MSDKNIITNVDLMMKNDVFSNANQIDSQNFMLNVLYKDPQNGKVIILPGTSIC